MPNFFIATFIFSLSTIVASCQNSPTSDQDVKINQQHKFEISPCEFKYNGKVFRLGGDIKELVNVFGPYNRIIDFAHAYVWDSIGISVICHHKTEKTSEVRICFDCCEWIEKSDKESTLPYKCFQGGILVEGALFGNGITIDQLNTELKAKGSKINLGYWEIMSGFIYEYNCKYDEFIYGEVGQLNHSLFIRPNRNNIYSLFLIGDSRETNRLGN